MKYCSEDNSHKTYIKKNGRPKWFRHPRTRKILCRNCHRKLKRASGPHDTVTMTLYNNTPKRSKLHKAMLIHFHHLAEDEGMPVSFKDFEKFTVDGIEYKMAHGTFRNHISQAIKDGDVVLACRSAGAWYALKGNPCS